MLNQCIFFAQYCHLSVNGCVETSVPPSISKVAIKLSNPSLKQTRGETRNKEAFETSTVCLFLIHEEVKTDHDGFCLNLFIFFLKWLSKSSFEDSYLLLFLLLIRFG